MPAQIIGYAIFRLQFVKSDEACTSTLQRVPEGIEEFDPLDVLDEMPKLRVKKFGIPVRTHDARVPVSVKMNNDEVAEGGELGEEIMQPGCALGVGARLHQGRGELFIFR